MITDYDEMVMSICIPLLTFYFTFTKISCTSLYFTTDMTEISRSVPSYFQMTHGMDLFTQLFPNSVFS